MKLSHVGKEFERDGRRTINLELPRERDHGVERTQIIALMCPQESVDFS
jgi:hypothetical protein